MDGYEAFLQFSVGGEWGGGEGEGGERSEGCEWERCEGVSGVEDGVAGTGRAVEEGSPPAISKNAVREGGGGTSVWDRNLPRRPNLLGRC